MPERLPLVILAGSDRRRVSVPPGMQAADMLTGHKGALRLADGKPLVAELMDRFRRSGRFQTPILVGPARVYQPLSLDCEFVDSEGALSDTLERAAGVVTSRFDSRTPVAFTACDILPTADELATLMADAYDPVAGSAAWSQLVAASPDEMGASRWKPGYALADSSGGPMNLYPGHLVVVRPAALRLRIMIRLLHLAYRYRNRPLWQHAVGVTLQGIGALVCQDLRGLARLQWPLLSSTIPYHWISGYLRYRRGTFRVPDLERTFARTLVHRGAQLDAGGRPIAVSITRIVSLAKDLDTKAELEEVARAPS